MYLMPFKGEKVQKRKIHRDTDTARFCDRVLHACYSSLSSISKNTKIVNMCVSWDTHSIYLGVILTLVNPMHSCEDPKISIKGFRGVREVSHGTRNQQGSISGYSHRMRASQKI
jgi:hypothetical protein